MSQNRNKLIKLLVGNLSNAVVHRILEKSISKEELIGKYRKEFITSFEIAKRYREKINPIRSNLGVKDIRLIKEKVINRVRAELSIRVSKGYENLDLDSVEKEVGNLLKELKVLK